MNHLQVDVVELDERVWKKWFQKGNLQEQARKRKWRIIAAIATALFCVAAAIYAFVAIY